jgi:hypothetical protein
MSSYRSAYENYYKNINNQNKDKNGNNYLTFGKKNHASKGSECGARINYNDTIMNKFAKRIIRELTGSTVLLLFFIGLKYIPSNQIQEIHIKCIKALYYNFNYDKSIDALNTIQIGNIRGEDLKVGDITIEDLKAENLKVQVSNFIEYLKNSTNIQN